MKRGIAISITLLALAWASLSVGGFETLPSLVSPVVATPLYMARAGRTCDNCHTDPTGWKNPKLSRRKCNLSCQTCHVSPTGGGLRTVSGRFYGQATLPMMAASHRPYKDEERHLAGFVNFTKNRRNRIGDPALGTPFGGSAPLAFDQSRYAGLNADPLIYGGLDVRMALWFPESRVLFFPMQFDLHLAAHPYRYVTAYASAGFLSKSQGFHDTFNLGCQPNDPSGDCSSRARGTPFMLKDAYVMVHQLPFSSYARVGRFLPPFGLQFDDHTLSTRRDFELNHGLTHSRVVGAEIGAAPNYPYFHAAVFRPNRRDQFIDDPNPVSPDELPPFLGVGGWGAAVSGGWRDLGFQAGFSGMIRRRALEDGGDTLSLSVNWGFNPWYYIEGLPLTYLGEIAIGQRQRLGSGSNTGQIALVQELSYLLYNGVNLRARHSYSDFDTQVKDDHYNRFSLGGDLILFPGLSLTGMARVQVNAGSGSSTVLDGLLFLRGWY